MRISPLDMRQQRFRTALRGYDRTEVVAFLTEAADDYEHALREIDRMRSDLARMESLLGEHRDREANLRNTMLTAQRLADEIKESAQNESKLIVREAQGRADLLDPEGAGPPRRRSTATSTSCACGGATSKDRSRPRSSRSIARSSSSATRIRIVRRRRSSCTVPGRRTPPRRPDGRSTAFEDERKAGKLIEGPVAVQRDRGRPRHRASHSARPAHPNRRRPQRRRARPSRGGARRRGGQRRAARLAGRHPRLPAPSASPRLG